VVVSLGGRGVSGIGFELSLIFASLLGMYSATSVTQPVLQLFLLGDIVTNRLIAIKAACRKSGGKIVMVVSTAVITILSLLA
jgi:hypothetical protein